MRVIHNSRDERYRKPFGARPCSSEVRLGISVELYENEILPDYVTLYYYYGIYSFSSGNAPLRLKNPGKSPAVYEKNLLLPDESGLLFYFFELKWKDDGRLYIYSDQNNPGHSVQGTKRPRFSPEKDRSRYPFQISIYNPNFKVPAWYAGHVMYQIFPDRFARHRNFSFAELCSKKQDPENIYHENWEEEVDFAGTKQSGYLACDFYGGSLKGISEKLPYLHSLGVGVLYLNPVFEARSNHRYDTADYFKVDPILGDENDFAELAEKARSYGIGIILDCAFSHTGADSLYFNRYQKYGCTGAWQAVKDGVYSEYSGWYDVNKKDGRINYSSWWGFPELPAVNENDLDYRRFVLGEEGVLKTWIKRGAKGFRLDVSDELPDSFIRSVRKSSKEADPDAVILGEVWEDASSKVSYESYRDFIFGNTHDSIMNYPFRNALLGFCGKYLGAERLRDLLETIRENYPPQAFASAMNLLSSHDVARFITEVAGDPDPGERELQAAMRLSQEQREFGEERLRLAYAFALIYPGTPSIYYGDENNMEGYRDPFNRRTFRAEESGENPTVKLISELSGLRKKFQLMRTGQVEWLFYKERRIILRRFFENGKDLIGNEVSSPFEAFILINDENRVWHGREIEGIFHNRLKNLVQKAKVGENEAFTGQDIISESIPDPLIKSLSPKTVRVFISGREFRDYSY